jgi:hypothetical protein
MTKIAGAGSASGFICQRHGSAEPDPHQNVMDSQHCSDENYTLLCVSIFILIFSIGARIFVTEFSPFEWSSNLLAVGLANSVLIGQIRLPEEDDSCKVGMLCEELLYGTPDCFGL